MFNLVQNTCAILEQVAHSSTGVYEYYLDYLLIFGNY